MAFPSVRFVDSPDEASAVRLDLNGVGGSVDVASLHDEFSLGMATLDGDPGRRDRRWGTRTLPLPLMLSGDRAAARAALNKLARQITRDGWLRWQLDAATPPVWFRTYASAPAPAGFDFLRSSGTRDRWLATLNLAADAFAVGAEIALGPYAITNAPTSGENAMQVTLPAIQGEMPTPALVRVSKTTVGGLLGPAVATLPHDVTTITAANWTAVVGGSTTAASYLGGSYRETNSSLTASGWANVCSFTPSASLPPGRRRALLRVSGSASTGAVLLRWVASSPAATSQVVTPPVLVSVAQMQRWVDVGVLPYPLADGAAVGVSSVTVYTLQAKRAVGGGQLRFDNRLLLLATDAAQLQVASPGDVGTAAADVMFDAERRAVVMQAGGSLVRPPATRGGWPTLRPDETNVLWVAQNLDPTLVTGRDDAIGSTTTVTLTYRPRYLWGIG